MIRWARIGHGAKSPIAAKLLMGLVDLVRFELTTSSMPFKKYQSLAGVLTRNKRLSGRRFGRRWTPRGGFFASGLRADSRTPHTKTSAPRAFTRAVARCSDCRLLEETTFVFLYKDDAQVEVGEVRLGKGGENLLCSASG